ncbi:hypothetical protein K7432_012450 [Basidiobolus ranarum]|uniref:Uncharacterized protein n=1 Tax=Basidiobolus ranarum TaxID=34480 RepID=A0ABR2VS91_9FUNG
MSKWTPTEMPNLKEKTVVITGANSGIGFYTALEFGRAGARVWLACRNPSKADEALTQLREQVPEGDFKVGKLDLSDLASSWLFPLAQLQKMDLKCNLVQIIWVTLL